MIKSNENITSTKKRLTIEIPSEAIEHEIQSTLMALKSRTKLPGFRQGKVPVALLEKKFGKEVEAEAMERIIPKYYSDALKEASIVPMTQPQLEGGMNLVRNEPLSLTFTLEIRPDIENLSYEGITVTDLPTKITDEDINQTLERLQQDKGSYDPSDDAIENDDIVIMDYHNKEDDKESKDEVFKVGTDILPKEFSDTLLGKKKGDVTDEFSATFPEGYYDKALASQSRTFKATIKEVKKIHTPALDDEFAKDLEFDSIDALKEHIRERLQEAQQKSIAKAQKAELINKLIEAHEFEPPESLVAAELENMLASARAQASQTIGMPTAEGEEQESNFDEAKAKEEFAPQAINHAKASIILEIVAEQEKVEVKDEEINQHIMNLSAQINLSPENIMKYYVSKDGSLEGLKHQVLEDKVMDLILEKAIKEPVKESETDEEK